MKGDTEMAEKDKKEKKEVKAIIETPDEKALQEMLKPAPGTEQISGEDILLPRLRLLQDTSAEVKAQESKAGKLKHSLTEIIVDNVEFIPISMYKSRIMFDVDNREGAPLCRSVDMKKGSDGTSCSECDNAQWKEGRPPCCNTIFNYLIIEPNQVGIMIMPTILSLMKTSSQAALKLNTSVEFTIPRQPFWNKVWLLTPKQKHYPKGPAYLLNVTQVRETNDKERGWCEMIYKNTVGKRIVEAEEQPTSDVIVDDLT
jgi:hypothetical protein